MDDKTKILIGFGVVTLGVVGYFVVRNMRNNKTQTSFAPTPDYAKVAPNYTKATTGGSQYVQKNTSKYPCLSFKNESFPLRKNMKGQGVLIVQKFINAFFKTALKEDGCFGSNTERELASRLHISSVSSDNYKKMFLALRNKGLV